MSPAKTLALPLLIGALSACVTVGAPAVLFPVAGPVLAHRPAPSYPITVRMGQVSATLPDGQVCQGPLEILDRNDPSSRRMEADWDRLYGRGFFGATFLGTDRAQAALTGSNGPCLRMEIFDPHPQDPRAPLAGIITDDHALESFEGIARDEQGNLFKVAFISRQMKIDPA